ncbi:MAG TPA: NADH-quinone oxidoreductase subunit NuoK [Thermomicrobiales bacterium]|nr:NADH-quinone oxidoreductase subunit NuoK [Thermomicrobiales bacterium]
MSELTAEHFLLLSGALFIIGTIGVLTRRNVLIIFMSVELMINAVNVAFVGFAWEQDSMIGQTFALFIIAVAAAESILGLGIIMALSRRIDSVDVADVTTLRD